MIDDTYHDVKLSFFSGQKNLTYRHKGVGDENK